MWSRLTPAKVFAPSRRLVGFITYALLLSAGNAGADDAWPAKLFNPAPISEDVILPMPCGGSMVFRKVQVPGSGILDDYQVKLGDPDQALAFSEYAHPDYIAAPFSGAGSGRYYLMAKYEISKLQYDAIMGTNCPAANLIGRSPVSDVTWLEAVEFAAKYTDWLLTNARKSLPSAGDAISFLRLATEAEWEYAERGGIAVSPTEFAARTFPMPDGMERYVWFAGSKSANGKVQLTGLLQPNPLGLHDMLGNVDEYVMDAYRLNRVSRAHGRAGGYIVKGGNYLTSEQDIRSSYRSEVSPYSDKGPRKSKTTGFRLVISAPVLTDPQDISDAKAEWAKLGTGGAKPSDADKPLEDPVQELAALAQQTDGNTALKSRLENLEQKVKSVLLAQQDQQARANRTMLRLGAWLGQKLHDDQINTNIVRETYQARVASSSEQDQMAERYKEMLNQNEQALAANMKFYTDLVIRVGDDYNPEQFTKQQEILKTELTSAGVTQLSHYADVFLQHIRQYANDKKVHSADWLKDLAAVADK
ncbi:formylglycine-generating enzyme family protein [Dongia soli]|uniref:SUMF1/EgtB/PvdO family nonheme iron enzyme n=1 Tax=Dongia soli TaxID=600628 RepID=A0ABU5ED82_9PROT|nr:SUMF1/EgtB/PvdO family nonheme iron enzyme [Dongia soli]MDY0883779.1 SUMF1/EgtB/PvdO family nonheme iron enzyme [Dongia soli]